MENDPPLLPIAREKINDLWYNYVKSHYPYEYLGIYVSLEWIRCGRTRRELILFALVGEKTV